MTRKTYALGKRYIKRNWETMDVETKFRIAQEIGGVRWAHVFLAGFEYWLENFNEYDDELEHIPMGFEAITKDDIEYLERILPSYLKERYKSGYSYIRGAGYNTVVDEYDKIREENNIP